MFRWLPIIVLWSGFGAQMYAQKDSVNLKTDTVMIREYDKEGRLTETRTWIGENFKYTDSYYLEGDSVVTQWDTIEAMMELPGVVYIRAYGEDGILKREVKEENNLPVYTRYYEFYDTLFSYTEFKDNGKVVNATYDYYEFYSDSTVRIISHFEKTRQDGRHQTFYRNGNRQCDCFYRKGERDSLQKMYYPNGQLKQYIIYSDGKPWEILFIYAPDGSNLEMGTLKDGNGTLYLYDDNGVFESVWEFRKGKVISQKP